MSLHFASFAEPWQAESVATGLVAQGFRRRRPGGTELQPGDFRVVPTPTGFHQVEWKPFVWDRVMLQRLRALDSVNLAGVRELAGDFPFEQRCLRELSLAFPDREAALGALAELEGA